MKRKRRRRLKEAETKLLKEIIKSLKKHKMARYDFGTFYLIKRKKHKAVIWGETLIVKPYYAVFFRGSSKLKLKIKKWKS